MKYHSNTDADVLAESMGVIRGGIAGLPDPIAEDIARKVRDRLTDRYTAALAEYCRELAEHSLGILEYPPSGVSVDTARLALASYTDLFDELVIDDLTQGYGIE